jgi:8-oxo-dGTP diphosphatase
MGEFIVGVKSLIICNRKALLVQRADGENKWEFPGGQVEFGEDLEPALLREVKEETDLDICIVKLLCAKIVKLRPERHVVCLDYLSRATSDKVKISDEHINFMWANKEQFENLYNKDMAFVLDKNVVLDSAEID